MRTDVDISLSALVRARSGKAGMPEAEREQLRLREAAREFEGLLLEQMVKEMRDAVPKGGLMGQQAGQGLFEEMLDGEFVRVMSKGGGIGIADFLAKSLGGSKDEG